MLSPQLISYLRRKEGKDHCLRPKTQEVDQVAGDVEKASCRADLNMWIRVCRVDGLTPHLSALALTESTLIPAALSNF